MYQADSLARLHHFSRSDHLKGSLSTMRGQILVMVCLWSSSLGEWVSKEVTRSHHSNTRPGATGGGLHSKGGRQIGGMKYLFGSQVIDEVSGLKQERKEYRDGSDTVRGYYAYSDGFFDVRVDYMADRDGYRVLSEKRQPTIRKLGAVRDGEKSGPTTHKGLTKIGTNTIGT